MIPFDMKKQVIYLQEQPGIFDQLTTAINKASINTSISIDPDAKKVIYTAVGTLSAALVIAAIINSRR